MVHRMEGRLVPCLEQIGDEPGIVHVCRQIGESGMQVVSHVP